jgi:hypothetical protein
MAEIAFAGALRESNAPTQAQVVGCYIWWLRLGGLLDLDSNHARNLAAIS